MTRMRARLSPRILTISYNTPYGPKRRTWPTSENGVGVWMLIPITWHESVGMSGKIAKARCVRTSAATGANIRDIDRDRRPAAAAVDGQWNALADADLFDLIGEVAELPNRLAIRRHDHVADRPSLGIHASQSRLFGRRARRCAHDDDTFDAEPRRYRFIRGHDADAGRWHATVADQLRHDPVHHVDRDRKADPGIRARRRKDCRVDTDQPSRGIEQRPARVAGIDRGVGLNDVGDLPPAAGGQSPFQRADDAGRERLVEPERVADRKRRLHDLEIRRAADRDRRWHLPHAAEPVDGEIVVRRNTDDACPHRLA